MQHPPPMHAIEPTTYREQRVHEVLMVHFRGELRVVHLRRMRRDGVSEWMRICVGEYVRTYGVNDWGEHLFLWVGVRCVTEYLHTVDHHRDGLCIRDLSKKTCSTSNCQKHVQKTI